MKRWATVLRVLFALLLLVLLAVPLAAVGETWNTGRNIASIVRETPKSGESYLRATASDRVKGESFSVVCLYPEPLNLLEKTEVTMRVRVPVQTAGIFSVHMTLYSGIEIFESVETKIDSGVWYTLSADISEWKQRSSVNGIEITFTDENRITDTFEFSDIQTGGKADLTLAEQFLTLGYTAQGGTAVCADNVYLLDAGEDGTLTLLADAARRDYTTAPGIAYLAVTVEGAKSGGAVSLAVSEGSGSAQDFGIASSANLLSGRHTYFLPFDSEMTLRAYRLTFRGLAAEGEAVRLCGVKLGVLEVPETEEMLGKLTECVYDTKNNLLTVSGTIPGATVSKHMGGTLALYALPMWSKSIDYSAPIATVRMSTRFTFSVNMAGKTSSVPLTRYAVCIREDNAFLPVTAPSYVTYPAPTGSRTISAVGICDCDTGGAFTANASAVMVDIDLSVLLAEKNRGKLITAGGQTLYLDTNVLHGIDESTAVPLATGVDVYFRLRHLPADGGEQSIRTLSAIVSALASRYEGIGGFVVQREGMDIKIYADVLRTVYNTAVMHIPDILTVAAFGEEEDSVLDAVTLSQRIQAGGVFPWGLLWKDTSTADARNATTNLTAQMKTLALSVPNALLHLWSPNTDYTADALIKDYDDACSAAVRDGLRVLFLSLAGRTDAETVFEGLKTVTDGTTRTLDAYAATVLSYDTAWKGLYTLADFSHSYSTYGWRAGDNCHRLTTKENELEVGERALNAVFVPQDGNRYSPVRGTILSLTDYTDNFTYAPALCFTLRVITEFESSETAEITFHFGSDDHRAEYTVSIPVGQPFYLCCDLSQFAWADSVDFMAITVSCSSAATLDIYSIAAGSDEYSNDSLSFLYRYRNAAKTETAEKGIEFTRPQIVAGAVILLMTVSVVALLSRHREEKEQS